MRVQARGTTPWRPLEKLVLVAEILATYVRVRALLWRHDLPLVVSKLRELGADATAPAESVEWEWFRYGNATVRVLEALPADARCLMRSLALMTVLARRGISSTVVIGVRTADGFAAHAWIERDEKALLWPGEGYERLLEL
jgi:Transglutaminase-like superfamily